MRAALVAASALLTAIAAAGCTTRTTSLPPATAAPPQERQVDWVEPSATEPPRFVFGVRRVEVLRDGWRAQVWIRNETDIPWRIGGRGSASSVPFGVMLFATGELDELSARNRDQDMPGIRAARHVQPAPPDVLAPDAMWEGTVSAPGALAAGRWLRVVLGPLFADGDVPSGFEPAYMWITDHAYLLQR